eukprot:UN01727
MSNNLEVNKVNVEAESRDPNRAVEGPLAYITKSSYYNGVVAFAQATGFAFGMDYFLKATKPGKSIFPRYGSVLPQHRFYGWTLFCLGWFQFNVEDTQITTIMKRNSDTYHLDNKQDELDYLRHLEEKKAHNNTQQQQKNAL